MLAAGHIYLQICVLLTAPFNACDSQGTGFPGDTGHLPVTLNRTVVVDPIVLSSGLPVQITSTIIGFDWFLIWRQ